MQIIKADRKGIEVAVKALRAGKSVVYPTDTAYGLGVDAGNKAAVRRLYKIKERGPEQPIHVIVHSLSAIKKLAVVSETARRLMKKYWPGALTIVLELKSELGGLKLLSAGTGTIGLRMPDNRVALTLARKLGRPITTTSANPSAHLSGGTTPYSATDSFEQFKNKKFQPDLYLDAGKLPKIRPSTIVSVKYDKIKVLRRGAIKL